MGQRGKNLIKACIIILSLIMGFSFVFNVLFVKNQHITRWKSFYKLKNNTVDLVFIGNSHSSYAYIPMLFDEILKVDTYGLCTAASTIRQNYYQLKEIFKSQSPGIVVLEMFSISLYDRMEEYKGYAAHRAFDAMPLSLNKIDAIRNNVDDDEFLKYLFPLGIYHLRWKEEELYKDLMQVFQNNYKTNKYNGYRDYAAHISSFIPNEKIIDDYNIPEFETPLPDGALELLDKIIDICEKNDAKLIIVSTPFVEQYNLSYDDQHAIINFLAPHLKKRNVDVVEFYRVHDKIGLDMTDMGGTEHLSYNGSLLISEYFADYIKTNYNNLLEGRKWDYIEDSQNKLIELAKEYKPYTITKDRLIKKAELDFKSYPNNMLEYLKAINDPGYIIIMSTKNSTFDYIDDDIVSAIGDLGLNPNFTQGVEKNYIGITAGREEPVNFEILSDKNISYTSESEEIIELNLPFYLNIRSSSSKTGCESSINIGRDEHEFEYMSKDLDGFNIVVYDKNLQEFVSSVNFNTNDVSQHYYNREIDINRFDEGVIIYRFDASKDIDDLFGVEAGKGISIEDGMMLSLNSDEQELILGGYNGTSNHIIVRLDINISYTTQLELYYTNQNDEIFSDVKMERVQLLNGDNEVFIELNTKTAINNIRIDFANTKPKVGNISLLIKGIEIADLS